MSCWQTAILHANRVEAAVCRTEGKRSIWPSDRAAKASVFYALIAAENSRQRQSVVLMPVRHPEKQRKRRPGAPKSLFAMEA